ncbi:glycerol-3-phosphate 1-O-acyltransferase [Spongiibacter sp. KMU-166]|uniref:Glycerol-3-phosphate acyltransferase n=1 Tax=Spongiibacter thalassae TaxID=2721624 RepID=A0ABX1GDM7_9GAMM|nr:glycerol-3-phosphate 1-O-acyltransferase [Spongiibacter thalassae]NKI16359.1 glycerol-3-phosphate 1-O-acyltransferase [Spongiibacter thalassae]
MNASGNTTVEQGLVYLAQTRGPTEKKIISQWLRQQENGKHAEIIYIDYPRMDASRTNAALRQRLARGDNPRLCPVRVAWLPKSRNGKPQVYLRDLIIIGDPRAPREYAKYLLAGKQAERTRILEGEPATVAELRDIWTAQTSATVEREFARFVVRRATLSLERSASQVLGPQYKMPRLVLEEIRSSARFKEGLRRLAEEKNLPLDQAEMLAEKALKELASGFTPLGLDINLILGRILYRRGYVEQLDIDPQQVEKVRAALRGKPGIILPSHRSNMDVGVMSVALHESGLPRTSTLGGINMSFWPMGYIMRRSGVIFIRRDIREDPTYRWVLKEYLGYMVEKRFSLQWYIEGTRSRTGKSLPPKLGLLKYVVDAYREGRCDDIALIPASTTYDQLNEVKGYAGEAMGAAKKKEDLKWMISYFKSAHGRFGRIYVRFGEPLSLSSYLGSHEEARQLSDSEYHLALQKLAFEISLRINQATPITAISLITMTALSAFRQALSFDQLRMALREFVEHTELHGAPMTASARNLLHDEGIQEELDALISQGLIHAETDGPEAVYTINRDAHVAASYYRNWVIHHYLDTAIAELALTAAANCDAGTDALETFWNTAYQLRDLLKFDFFFLEKNQFRQALNDRLNRINPNWQHTVSSGRDATLALLDGMQPITADSVLRCFLESYWVTAVCMKLRSGGVITGDKDFFKFCAGAARQYLLQKRIIHLEAASLHLFKTGLQIAQNRGVTNAEGHYQPAAGQAHIEELEALLQLSDQRFDSARRTFNLRYFNRGQHND